MKKDNKEYVEIAIDDISKIDFNLITVGKREHSFNHIYNNRLSNIILAYVKSGEAVYHVNENHFKLHQGMVYIIDPKSQNYYDASNTDWSIYWICIGGDGVADLTNKLGLSNKNPVFEVNDKPSILNLYEHLFELSKKSQQFNVKIEIKITFYSLILELLKSRTKNSSFEVDYIFEINSYIENNYHDNIKVSNIAKYLKLDRSYISRLYKSRTGLTIKDKIQITRLNSAKKMLKFGKSVSETAFQCGFSDALYFSKVYKNYFGISPVKEHKK